MSTLPGPHDPSIPQWVHEEMKDGDRICEAAGVQRTEGGRLPVQKIINRLTSVPSTTPKKPGETPRTEAMIESCGDYEKAYRYNGRFAEFARQLERELVHMSELLAGQILYNERTASHEQRITASGVQQADALPAVHQGQETKASDHYIPSHVAQFQLCKDCNWQAACTATRRCDNAPSTTPLFTPIPLLPVATGPYSAWLLERGSPAEWVNAAKDGCVGAVWTRDFTMAQQFRTKYEAENYAECYHIDDATATDHMFNCGVSEAAASIPSAIEQRRWDLVRRWFTQQEQLYIPGIHQARTVEAVNEAVDRALHRADGGKQT